MTPDKDTNTSPIQRLIQDQNERAKAEGERSEELAKFDQLGATILAGMQGMITYMERTAGKTEVMNPVTSVSTPDSAQVVAAVEENTKAVKESALDPTQAVEELRGIKEKLGKLPTEYPAFPAFPELPSTMEVPGLAEYVKNQEKRMQVMEDTYKDLKVIVEPTPVIVKEGKTEVRIEKPDMTALDEGMKTMRAMWENIQLPTPVINFDLEALLTEIKTSNTWLKKIKEKPTGGGGGGGGGPVFKAYDGVAHEGMLAYPELTAAGKIPVDTGLTFTTTGLATEAKQDATITAIGAIGAAPSYRTVIDDTTTPSVTYIGKAVLTGSSISKAGSVWQIKKIDETAGTEISYADGDTLFNNVWNNRATTVVYN